MEVSPEMFIIRTALKIRGFCPAFAMLAFWRNTLLLGLAAGNVVLGEDVITDDTVFYGESPAVYPSRMLIHPCL